MKTIILAGGVGSRLSEETVVKPKPMVEVGGMPILWHIMSHYAHYGHKEFIVALGYKGDYIKRYFKDYHALSHDMRVDLATGEVVSENPDDGHDWKVELVDTGKDTLTGGRIKRLADRVNNERFFLTWGDGVSTIDFDALLKFHKSHGKLITVSAVRPAARFGAIELDGDKVTSFTEKPQLGEGWINGAFFVCEPGIFEYIEGDMVQFERAPMEGLANDGQLMAYKHEGFWQCMDTLRDKVLLEKLWREDPPWKIWE
jgi:glucose-1-phosphate cytidylyltransferase